MLEENELFERLLLERLSGPFISNGGLPMFFAGFVGGYEGSDAISEVYVAPTIEWIVLFYCRLEKRPDLVGRHFFSILI